MRSMESNQGALDFETFTEIIKIALPAGDGTQSIENPFQSFPGKISFVRAYVYACTVGKRNTNYFSDDDFLAGINRFGIESPSPSVSTRCALYGNSQDIHDTLKILERR
jgi:hypothetical protein